MRNYTDRRKIEVARRDQSWFDMQPIEKQNTPEEPRYPIRVDEKTVIWVRRSRMHKYFPLPGRDDTVEEYIEKFNSGPSKFIY